MGTDLRYDICLSFAGEQRDYVEQVAAQLRQAEVRVFYDRYEAVNLWGEDLVQHLDTVFRKQARFCVIFVSAAYARKVWITHELRSIQARAIRNAAAYILPVRFDDTPIPGLHDTVGYLDAVDLTPEQVAEFVLEKLAGPDHAHNHRMLEYSPVPRCTNGGQGPTTKRSNEPIPTSASASGSSRASSSAWPRLSAAPTC